MGDPAVFSLFSYCSPTSQNTGSFYVVERSSIHPRFVQQRETDSRVQGLRLACPNSHLPKNDANKLYKVYRLQHLYEEQVSSPGVRALSFGPPAAHSLNLGGISIR